MAAGGGGIFGEEHVCAVRAHVSSEHTAVISYNGPNTRFPGPGKWDLLTWRFSPQLLLSTSDVAEAEARRDAAERELRSDEAHVWGRGKGMGGSETGT